VTVPPFDCKRLSFGVVRYSGVRVNNNQYGSRALMAYPTRERYRWHILWVVNCHYHHFIQSDRNGNIKRNPQA